MANPTLDKLTFTISDDGTYYSVKGLNSSISGDVVIPAEYNGKPVALIEENAFIRAYNITSVEIPNTIIIIDDGAFKGNYNLISVVIPDSVTYIGEEAFASCYSLESIEIPDTVTEIGASAFSACEVLPSITLPNTLTHIPEHLFEYCITLESIVIPNSVKSIGEGAFTGCESLTEITFNNSIETIGDFAFSECLALESIVLPKSLKELGSGAFFYCEALVQIEFLSKPTYYHEYYEDDEVIIYPTFAYCWRLGSAARQILCHTSGGWKEGDTLIVCASETNCSAFSVTIINDGAPLPVMYIGTTPVIAVYFGSQNVTNIL